MHIKQTITRAVEVQSTPRVKQLEGKFDLEPLKKEKAVWRVDLTLPETWNVGLINGASGSGKTTVARLIADKLGAVLQTPRDERGGHIDAYDWPKDKAIIEAIAGPDAAIDDVTALLSSVGFSSPPAWRLPFHVLSYGQQFRATLARTLSDSIADGKVRVVDEYSSVIDRQVAKIGSAAVAKSVRRYDRQFIAVTCHHDVIDWLEPDWVIECGSDQSVTLSIATSNGATRRWLRPRIDVRIVRTGPEAWAGFKANHYLSHELAPQSNDKCFLGCVDGEPAVFAAVLHFPQQQKGLTFREHRIVTLPDYQGVGLGSAVSDAIAAMVKGATGRPYYSLTSHPAFIAHRLRRPEMWRQTRRRGYSNGSTGLNQSGSVRRTSRDRLTSAFEYVGPLDPMGGRALGMHRWVDG